MQEDIAQKVRYGGGPTGQRANLASGVWRLKSSLEVAEKWLAATNTEGAEALATEAEYMRDKIEEEYSLACFEVAALRRQQIINNLAEDRGHEPPVTSGPQHRAGMLSDALLDAYCLLREGSHERRYEVMGALRLAMDLIPEELGVEDEQGER